MLRDLRTDRDRCGQIVAIGKRPAGLQGGDRAELCLQQRQAAVDAGASAAQRVGELRSVHVIPRPVSGLTQHLA